MPACRHRPRRPSTSVFFRSFVRPLQLHMKFRQRRPTSRRDLLIGSGALVVTGHGIVKVLSSCIGSAVAHPLARMRSATRCDRHHECRMPRIGPR